MNSADSIALIIALAVSTFLGYSLTTSLLPSNLPRRWIWVLAPAAGFGLSSFVAFLFRRPMFTVESFLVLVCLIVWVKRRRIAGFSLPFLSSRSWRPPALSLALMGALGLAMAGMMIQVYRLPHAAWDGWAIWNSHARLIYRDGQQWENKIQYTFHADYPEFTPMIAARFWRYLGHEVPEAGAVVGVLLGLSAVALLGMAVSELRGSTPGLLLALTLLATPSYLEHASNQYADIPLAFFILSTVALICLHSEQERADGRLLVLAGFMAGCAGWTKNEGLLFIVAVCTVLLLPSLTDRSVISRRFVPFFAGLLLPLAVIIFFKATIAPQNDIIGAQSYERAILRTSDINLHSTILKNFGTNFWVFGRWSLSPMLRLFAFIGL
jgi:hypothetical protein